MLTLIFLALCGILVLGNVLARIFGGRGVQFYFDVGVLSIISATILYMMLTGYSDTILSVMAIDRFSLFFMLIATLGLAMVGTVAYSERSKYGDFAVMSSFSLIGAYIVAGSVSVISVFLGLELMSVASIFVVIMSRKSIEASVKFFIMASISIAVLALAIVMLYGGSNSFALSAAPQGDVLLLAAVLFIAAIGVEASIFPFNVLIPDVYEGSPAFATGMLGGINKKMGFAALMQVLLLVFVKFGSLPMLLAILSVLTMLYGNVAALMQRKLKRMLAYSSISQAGYIMIGLAMAQHGGVSAALVQIFAHAFLFIGVFAIVGWLETRNRVEIDDVIGLNKENRLAAFAMTLFLLSMAGLPFTTGFIGKLLLFVSAINGGFAWLALIGILNSVISIYYYARPIMAAYTMKDNAVHSRLRLPLEVTVIACVIITVALGLFPQPLIGLAQSAAAALAAR